jgi:tetratricopeptide (TPR) repeat protein
MKIMKRVKYVKGEQSKECANAQNNIGVIHQEKGDYDKALEYYFKSLEIKKIVLG